MYRQPAQCVYVHCVTAGLWMFVVVGQLCPHLRIFTVVRVSKLKTHKKKDCCHFSLVQWIKRPHTVRNKTAYETTCCRFERKTLSRCFLMYDFSSKYDITNCHIFQVVMPQLGFGPQTGLNSSWALWLESSVVVIHAECAIYPYHGFWTIC